MTTTKYILARIGLAFGIQRRNIRMADAANETHLLRDAELHLGLALWEQCEPLEEVSVEYWNARKILKDLKEKGDQLEVCKARLNAAHEERAKILVGAGEQDPALVAKKESLIKQIDLLAAQRDEVVANARRLRRAYDGLKTKLEYLREGGAGDDDEGVRECRKRMAGIKGEFEQLKANRDAIAHEIAQKDDELAGYERQLGDTGKARRGDATQAFQLIGEYNQEVATLNAEIGLLKKRKLELCAEIGRYLSRNFTNNPECAAICKRHRGMIEIMAALRRSITYNHRIAGV